ncbi:MAG: LTA synthase family protein [Bacteroidaceae bacterium]|nr:LTA synthase family protein [Bacteroidaceae bacterium]
MSLPVSFIIYFLLLCYTHYGFIGDDDLDGPLFVAILICNMSLDAAVVTVFTGLFGGVKPLHRFSALWGWIVAAVFWLFCLSNVVYFRQFHDCMDLTLIGEVRNFDILAESIGALVRAGDIVVTALYFCAFYFLAWRRQWRRLAWMRLRYFAVLAVLSFFGIYGLVARGTRNYSLEVFAFMDEGSISSSVIIAEMFGLTQLTAFNLYHSDMNRDATDDDRRFMNNHRERFMPLEGGALSSGETATDTVAGCAKAVGKCNVVFVLMEAIVSDAVTAVCSGDTVMPNLWRMARGASYANFNMRSEVHNGWSSDGQLIYMTGLLPHSRKVVVSSFAGNEYIGLGSVMKEKGMQTAMVIPTGGHIWHQDRMCRAYGIDSLYAATDYGEVDDGILMDYAIETLGKLKGRPFFLTVLNMTTHTPFSKQFGKRLKDFHDDKLPKNKLYYYERANFFDFHLGRFIAVLKKEGLWQNTLVVIASDHHVGGEWSGDNRDPIPLIFTGGVSFGADAPNAGADNANAGADLHAICQTDFYPTMLGLFGTKQKWRGVGSSIFSADKNKLSEEEKQTMSDIIFETDWFGLK